MIFNVLYTIKNDKYKFVISVIYKAKITHIHKLIYQFKFNLRYEKYKSIHIYFCK